jgi:hypothetical protein
MELRQEIINAPAAAAAGSCSSSIKGGILMGKKKGNSGVGYALVFIVTIIAVAVMGNMYLGWGKTGAVLPGQTTPQNPTANCGSTNLAAVALQFFNAGNVTSAENNDTTVVCTGGGVSYAITDTTSPSATNMNCGYDYVCKFVSQQGASSKLLAVKNGPGQINADGNLVFSANQAAINIDVSGTRFGPLEARLYDNSYAAYTYTWAGTTAGGWSSAGTTAAPTLFGNTTINAPAGGNDTFTIGSGGKLNLKMDLRVLTNQNTQLDDRGWYLFFDMPTAVYSVPSIAVNGVTRASDCTVLNNDEKLAYNSQEYCYKITGIPVTNNNYATVDMVINAVSGVNPTPATGNITVTVVPIGAYQSTLDTKNVKVGAVKDDTSQTLVYANQVWGLPVS